MGIWHPQHPPPSPTKVDAESFEVSQTQRPSHLCLSGRGGVSTQHRHQPPMACRAPDMLEYHREEGKGAYRGCHFVPVCHKGTEPFTKQGACCPAGEQ